MKTQEKKIEEALKMLAEMGEVIGEVFKDKHIRLGILGYNLGVIQEHLYEAMNGEI